MQEIYYYLNLTTAIDGELEKDNRQSCALPLVVNCAGSINTTLAHKSENAFGRLDYYLIYLTSGSLIFSNGTETKRLSVGDVLILPPNSYYCQEYRDEQELNYLWVHFTGGQVEEILNDYGILKFPQINKTHSSNHLQTRFQRLFDCFVKKDFLLERDLSASLDKLLIEIARAVINREKPKISLSKSLNYINNNYNTQIKITDLAKMEALSMTRFNLHFKEQIGMPPTKYIINLRMASAKELLEESDLPIKQIGAMCGYDDYNFFAKTFKELFALSPKKYRENFKHK